MNLVKILPPCFFLLTLAAFAQQSNGPDQKPNVYLQNDRPKNGKESNTRTIEGTIKDSTDNPLAGGIVQLKDMKSSKIVDFVTKDDGKFAFHDLPMDINYELTATRRELTAPVKKVSVYDTRKNIILTFQLAVAKQ
jgi:hypothetical protein